MKDDRELEEEERKRMLDITSAKVKEAFFTSDLSKLINESTGLPLTDFTESIEKGMSIGTHILTCGKCTRMVSEHMQEEALTGVLNEGGIESSADPHSDQDYLQQ